MRILFYFLFCICVGKSSFAQLHLGPASSAKGGAGRASMDVVEAPFLNPAILALLEKNYLSMFYGLGSSTESNPMEGQVGLVMLDASKDTIAPGSFSYVRDYAQLNGEDNKINQYALSMGKFVSDGFAIGLSVIRQEMEAIGIGNKYADHNINFGALYNFNPMFSLSLTSYNLFQANRDRMPLIWAVGSRWQPQKFMSLYLDWEVQSNSENTFKPKTMFGLEFDWGMGLAWRAGYQWDQLKDRNFYTLGLSWIGPRLSLNYAYQNLQEYDAESLHSVDFRVFF